MQVVANIVVLSAIYALICCGFVLVYRVSRVLNLAHGELMMLGAYGLLTTAWLFADNPYMAVAAALGLSLLIGVLVYVALMRRMAGELVFAAVLVTIALGIAVRGISTLIWTAQVQYPRQALGIENPSVVLPGDAVVSIGQMVTVGLAVAVAHLFGVAHHQLAPHRVRTPAALVQRVTQLGLEHLRVQVLGLKERRREVGHIVRDQLLPNAGELHHALQDRHRAVAEHPFDHRDTSVSSTLAGSDQHPPPRTGKQSAYPGTG